MSAYPPVPRGPIQTPPPGHADSAAQLAALRDVLAGVDLGGYDERVLAWLAGSDWPTVAVVVSLLRRARMAGRP